jgi:kumamolisin
MSQQTLHKLKPSFREAPTAERLGDVSSDEKIRLTVVLKPGTPLDPTGPRLSRADYARRHGTKPEIIRHLTDYARDHGLTVEAADPATHRVVLTGSYGDAMRAFAPEGLGRYRIEGREVIARSGHLAVPEDLAADVVAVLGFDRRPIARPHSRFRPAAATGQVSYDPAEIAKRYDFPTDTTGTGQTIALIELGGGYDAQQMADYFSTKDINRTGTLQAVSVDGVGNTPSGGADGPDGEVQLDIQVAGSVAPGADIAVYFASNQGSGFSDAVAAAVHDATRDPAVISISWGGPESGWPTQDTDAMDQLFQTAATLGITVCVASGDAGASDGSADGSLTVDFPASSPHALGCGGTHLPREGAETAWNDGAGGGASGGGYSTRFQRPSWQTGNAETGRGVPDVAGDADPATGYNIAVDGQETVAGGTSAVAPLWAGLVALVNASLGRKIGFLNPALYADPAALTDITKGTNNGYSAAKGWDPVTGLGSPKGSAVQAAAAGGES